MTRVLHVVWEYPPVVYGGLARHAEHLARAQQAAGTTVDVVTAAEDVTAPARRVPATSTLRRGIAVHRARRPAPRTPWTDLLAAAAELGDALVATGLTAATASPTAATASPTAAAASPTAAGPVDVVHGHDWTAFPAARTLAARLGVPLVMTVHATEHGRRLGNLAPDDEHGTPARIHAVECEAVAAADLVVVCTSFMRDEVVDVLGAAPDRVRVVPNAVAVRAWRAGPNAVRAARRHWSGPDALPAAVGPASGAVEPVAVGGDVLIAAAGRIEWEKGFSTLVRALPDLVRMCGNVRVVLAGRGSEEPRLRALAAELGVAHRLLLPGWLSRPDLAALYAAADAVVVPSRYEPSGLVVREAQAAGAAVVATRVGGLAEAVTDGETGLLIGVGDVHGLRDTVARLVADPPAARRLGVAAAAAVERWTWADVAAATEAVYREAVTGTSGDAPPVEDGVTGDPVRRPMPAAGG